MPEWLGVAKTDTPRCEGSGQDGAEQHSRSLPAARRLARTQPNTASILLSSSQRRQPCYRPDPLISLCKFLPSVLLEGLAAGRAAINHAAEDARPFTTPPSADGTATIQPCHLPRCSQAAIWPTAARAEGAGGLRTGNLRPCLLP